jgi:hypothetical protein
VSLTSQSASLVWTHPIVQDSTYEVIKEIPLDKISHEETSEYMDSDEIQVKAEEIRSECEVFDDVPDGTLISVKTGKNFNLRSVKIKKHVPDTQEYKIFSFINPKSKRKV